MSPWSASMGRQSEWGQWEDMNERERWLKKVKGDYVVDLVFANLDMR